MNYLIFSFFSYLIFIPSITFSVIQAEIFPWAMIFTMLYIVKIDKRFLFIMLLILSSSIYGYYQSGGSASLQVLRSLAAYLNTTLILIFLLQTNFSLVKRLFPVVKIMFYLLIIWGFLQYFELISFLDPFIKILIPRGNADSLAFFNRGVTLLSSEPSRASYEFLFIYVAYRTIFLDRKNYFGFDCFITMFILFIIKSATGLVLLFVFFIIFYRLKFIVSAFLLAVVATPFLEQLSGRSFELIMVLLTSNSLESIYQVMLNLSGFRLISIMASIQYGFHEFFGGGIGNWELSSLQALNLTGYNPQEISYFQDISDGQWVSLRPTSYFAALMLDTGIFGTFIIAYYLYIVLRKFFKIDTNSKAIILLFLFYLIMVGSVGNPVPFIATAIALTYLYTKNLEID